MFLAAGCGALQSDSPLQLAAANDDTSAIAALLKNGARIDQRGAHGLTPLISAARSGAIHAIRMLAAHGADLNVRAGVNGWTPLMHAIHKLRVDSVGALLDAGADVNARSPDGMTPLMMASSYGYTEIVEILLARGANARLRLGDGMNALSLAILGAPDVDRFTIANCQLDTAKALLAKAPDLKLPSDVEEPLRSLMVAKLKGCAGLAPLFGRFQAKSQEDISAHRVGSVELPDRVRQ